MFWKKFWLNVQTFEGRISTKYNTVWLVNINKVQQLHASSIICVYMFKKKFKIQTQSMQVWKNSKKILKSNSNQTRLKRIQKIFKVQFKSTGFEKISKNFQSSTQVGSEWKNFKILNAWLRNVRKFWKYPKSKPMMAEPGKISKFQIQKPLSEKIKINKFKVQTGWDIFKLFQNNYSSTLKSMAIQCIHMVFEKEMVGNQVISFTNKNSQRHKMFQFKFN